MHVRPNVLSYIIIQKIHVFVPTKNIDLGGDHYLKRVRETNSQPCDVLVNLVDRLVILADHLFVPKTIPPMRVVKRINLWVIANDKIHLLVGRLGHDLTDDFFVYFRGQS